MTPSKKPPLRRRLKRLPFDLAGLSGGAGQCLDIVETSWATPFSRRRKVLISRGDRRRPAGR
jgi:hypothetical protein